MQDMYNYQELKDIFQDLESETSTLVDKVRGLGLDIVLWALCENISRVFKLGSSWQNLTQPTRLVLS